jgi:hypothetical protein
VLVRAHRPAVQTIEHRFHAGERKRGVLVVGVEIAVDGHAEARAFVVEHVTERDVLRRHAQRDERRDERGIGVEQRAVEVEDRDEQGRRR